MADQTQSKAIVLGMLFKMDVANPNAGWTEGTVTALKKIETVDNQRYPYISGQALRRYLRDTVADIAATEADGQPVHRFSPEKPGDDPKSPILTEGRPDLYLDDDLFGFMRAMKRGTRRRESPLRVSAAFGLFPYMGDRDLGTRSALRVTSDPEKGGAIFETEITNNVFRSTWLVELDRVGRWHGYERSDIDTKDLASTGELGLEERRKRVQELLRAIKYLYGGARQARLLVELVPQFVIYARLTKKLPIFLNSLSVKVRDGGYDLDPAPLIEVVEDYAVDMQALLIGMREGFVQTTRESLEASVAGVLEGKQGNVVPQVLTIGAAVDKMMEDIKGAEF